MTDTTNARVSSSDSSAIRVRNPVELITRARFSSKDDSQDGGDTAIWLGDGYIPVSAHEFPIIRRHCTLKDGRMPSTPIISRKKSSMPESPRGNLQIALTQ
jgi:hypothetical protein